MSSQSVNPATGQIEAGAVFVDGPREVKPPAALRRPLRRELSEYGIRKFVTIKLVWIA